MLVASHAYVCQLKTLAGRNHISVQYHNSAATYLTDIHQDVLLPLANRDPLLGPELSKAFPVGICAERRTSGLVPVSVVLGLGLLGGGLGHLFLDLGLLLECLAHLALTYSLLSLEFWAGLRYTGWRRTAT